MTQSQFAKVLRVSVSYVQKVELGEKVISDELANLIMAQYGVHAESLKSPDSQPKSLFWALGGTLEERIEEWKKKVKFLNDEALQTFREHIAVKMDILFEAAAARGKGFALGVSLDRWISDVEDDLGLTDSIHKIVKERNGQGSDIAWTPYFSANTRPDGTVECVFASNSKSSMANLEGPIKF